MSRFCSCSAVYFNPAKTIGAMIEADIFCIVGLICASFSCLASMSLFWWLELSPGWEWLGDLFVIVWVGVTMSIVAWTKRWMVCGYVVLTPSLIYNCILQVNPSFNTGQPSFYSAQDR